MDTDRKDLINCLTCDQMQGELPGANKDCSNVLTRLLKGQDPSMITEQGSFTLDLQEVSCIK